MSKIKFVQVALLGSRSKAGELDNIFQIPGVIDGTATTPATSFTATNTSAWDTLTPANQKMLTDMGYNAERFNSAGSLDQSKILQAGAKVGNQGMNALDYMNTVAGGVGAAINVASYFDNKSMLKTQKRALNENIAASREERAYRAKFRGDTASAFAQ